MARQFDLSHAAVQRHKPHVLESVAKAIRRSEAKNGDKLKTKWEERLDESYLASRRGLERAETDPEQWAQGAKYIVAGLKAVEMGLRVDGLIVGGEGKSTVINVDQVVVLPMGFRPELPAPMDENVIDVNSVSDSSIETYVENSDES